MEYIKGFEGKYMINESGQIWSVYKNGFLIPEKITKYNKKGEARSYLRVKLSKNGVTKGYLVHILMAQAFNISSIDGYYEEINHKDCDGTNNARCNLEWCSKKYNGNYGNRREKISKTLTEVSELKIAVKCIELDIIYESIHEAARQLNLKSNGIWNALNGHAHTCGGYHWEYV